MRIVFDIKYGKPCQALSYLTLRWSSLLLSVGPIHYVRKSNWCVMDRSI